MKVRKFEAAAQKIAAAMEPRREVLAVYIFGSTASGRSRPNSDIDIAVLVDSALIAGDLFEYRLHLIAALQDLLKRADVEAVLLNQAPPVLAHNVVSKGRLVFERSRSARIRFQIQTFNLYVDTKPMRDLHLKLLKRRYLDK